MRVIRLVAVAVLLGVACCSASRAQMLDVFGTRHSSIDMSPFDGAVTICPAHPPAEALTLDDAITRVLCNAPAARNAFAMARARAAEVGIAKAAYLPTINATGGVERTQTSTTYHYAGIPGFTSTQQGNARYGSLDLNWVLFDFGQRSAALDNADQLLNAAYATYDATLQAAFVDAAQAYYDVTTASASVIAARVSEESACKILEAAAARHAAGAGTLADELQARTACTKATLSRVTDEGKLKTVEGSLAILMGLAADTPVMLAPDVPPVEPEFLEAVSGLIEQAKLDHPKVRAARAKLEAARAGVDSAWAQGLPTISLTGNLSINNPADQPAVNTSMRERVIGVQISIPLFEGFARGYRVADARAQVDAARADLAASEQDVSRDVWASYQALATATENVDESRSLVAISQESLKVSRGRYQAGAGTIIELLDAQAAAADAQQQEITSLSAWRSARLKLTASLGQLGLWSIK
ncbi:TolC family protein [Paraburkholderia solisilvae]|uniref:Protein CyaE n=1 Tax=Paraburkholderia solisilvae TaxID=624376 RepID=A0A6J5DHG9_9BURK|nr:TolC family protein [Paraburkholderia solisilvae]CAB3753578.1 hypothetical protein LMG29739_01771 [Paraburkholderia solisilvae]